jgi:hypothetical protein
MGGFPVVMVRDIGANRVETSASGPIDRRPGHATDK